MTRTRREAVVTVVLAMLLGGSAAVQQKFQTGGRLPDNRPRQPDPATYPQTVRHVQGNVYVVAGAGGHVTVLPGDEGVLIVDDQFDVMRETLTGAIRQISGNPVRIVINTHVHPDHTGGNVHFGGLGALIVAHDNVRRAMMRPANAAATRAGWPVITFDQRLSLHFNGEEVSVIPAARPSHTNGDAFIYFRTSDVLAAGDGYTSTYPGIGVGDGGTSQGFIDNWNMLLDVIGPRTRIVPGHGQISTREDIAAQRDAVIAIRDRLRKMAAQGMTLEQVKAAAPTKDFDARFGYQNADRSEIWTTDRWIEVMYTEAQGRTPTPASR